MEGRKEKEIQLKPPETDTSRTPVDAGVLFFQEFNSTYNIKVKKLKKFDSLHPEVLDPEKFLPFAELDGGFCQGENQTYFTFEICKPDYNAKEDPWSKFRLFFPGLKKTFGNVHFRVLEKVSSIEEARLAAQSMGKEAIQVIAVRGSW